MAKKMTEAELLAECEALDASYASAADFDEKQYAKWLAANPGIDLEAEAEAAHEGSERESRERRP